jgi:hypothetical protein
MSSGSPETTEDAMTKKPKSPRLTIEITPQTWDRAKQASSGGCLIADALKKKYPNLSSVQVDVATITASDRGRGERYTWLTPPSAQVLLLAFDQGWAEPDEHVIRLNGAVRIQPIKAESRTRTVERQIKFDELSAREEEELTREEKISLTAMRRGDETRGDSPRPTTLGTAEVPERSDGPDAPATVIGGKSAPKVANPNLLAGRNRLFGARVAKPSEPFQRAVEAELAVRLGAGE